MLNSGVPLVDLDPRVREETISANRTAVKRAWRKRNIALVIALGFAAVLYSLGLSLEDDKASIRVTFLATAASVAVLALIFERLSASFPSAEDELAALAVKVTVPEIESYYGIRLSKQSRKSIPVQNGQSLDDAILVRFTKKKGKIVGLGLLQRKNDVFSLHSIDAEKASTKEVSHV